MLLTESYEVTEVLIEESVDSSDQALSEVTSSEEVTESTDEVLLSSSADTTAAESTTTYTIDDLYALIEVTNNKFDTLLSYNGTIVQDVGMFFGIWFIFTCWTMIKKFVGRLSTHGKEIE